MGFPGDNSRGGGGRAGGMDNGGVGGSVGGGWCPPVPVFVCFLLLDRLHARCLF